METTTPFHVVTGRFSPGAPEPGRSALERFALLRPRQRPAPLPRCTPSRHRSRRNLPNIDHMRHPASVRVDGSGYVSVIRAIYIRGARGLRGAVRAHPASESKCECLRSLAALNLSYHFFVGVNLYGLSSKCRLNVRNIHLLRNRSGIPLPRPSWRPDA